MALVITTSLQKDLITRTIPRAYRQAATYFHTSIVGAADDDFVVTEDVHGSQGPRAVEVLDDKV